MRTHHHAPQSGGTGSRPRAAHAAPETRQAAMRPRTGDLLLYLQRSAGNQATAGLLRSSRAGLALQRANGGAPAPGLSAPMRARGEEGVCGNFSRVRDWNVTNPVQGLIIQKVTRTFTVERSIPGTGWTPITGAALDAYVTDPDSTVHATVGQYWELWTVDAHGTVSDGGDDTFALCSLIADGTQHHDTTKGSFVISGEARFYSTGTAPAALGFTRGGGGVEVAGGLYSRLTDPAGAISAAGLTTVSQPVTFTVTVTWDSTSKPGGVGRKRKAGAVYTPAAAWSTVVVS